MRVHLGSDHAGFELKAHLDRPPRQSGARARRRRAAHLRPRRRLPPVLRRRRSGRPRRPRQPRHRDRRLGQRRADRGQQGPRHPLRAGLERHDRAAGPPAQRRPGRRHRCAHAQPGGGCGAGRGVRADAVLGRPAPPAAHRHGRRLRAHRHPAAAPVVTCPKATPSTGSPSCTRRRYVGRPVAVSSPQGRFATTRSWSTAACSSRRRRTASTCSTTTGPTSSCTCTWACTGSSPTTGCPPRSRAARCGCA